MQLIRALVRSLTQEQFRQLCEQCEISERGFYDWLNRAASIPYTKLVTICDYLSKHQERQFTITDLLNPAEWYKIKPKPVTPRAKRIR